MTGAWGTGKWRGAGQGARLAQLGLRHSSMSRKKRQEIPSWDKEGEKSWKKIHLAAARAASTPLLSTLFQFARIWKVVFSIWRFKAANWIFPLSVLGGICRLHVETSRKALTPWPTSDSSLKLKFLDPLLNPDPHRNPGTSPFPPLAESCL